MLLREENRRARTLADVGGALEALFEPFHGLGVLTTRHVKASESVEGRRVWGERDHTSMTRQRAVEISQMLFGDLGHARPQLGGGRSLSTGLEPQRLLGEHVGERALRAGLLEDR